MMIDELIWAMFFRSVFLGFSNKNMLLKFSNFFVVVL